MLRFKSIATARVVDTNGGDPPALLATPKQDWRSNPV